MRSHRSIPYILNKIHEARMQDPERFKSKDLAARDASLDGDNARNVVGDRLTKRLDHGVGVYVGPVQRSEEPIKLFKQWVLLYIAPSVQSTLDRKFNKALLADNIIECAHV